MRHPIPLLTVLTFLPFAATAAPPTHSTLPPDVPAKHFAAGAVGRVVGEKIMGRDLDGRFRGDKPVTRYELAVVLDRFVRYEEAARKPLHSVLMQPHVAVPPKATAIQKQALHHLVSYGFLPPQSPLLTQNGTAPVTAQELSNALASVTIRLSDRAEAVRKD